MNQQQTITDEEWIEIGTIVAPQGLHGELRVYPDSDFPERFLVPGTRWLKHPHTEHFIRFSIEEDSLWLANVAIADNLIKYVRL